MKTEGYLKGESDWEDNLLNGIYKEPENPYCQKPSSEFSSHEEWEIEWKKNRDWFAGYRDSEKKFFDEKYKITELKKNIKKMVTDYGLLIENDDGYVYVKTPEGYSTGIF